MRGTTSSDRDFCELAAYNARSQHDVRLKRVSIGLDCRVAILIIRKLFYYRDEGRIGLGIAAGIGIGLALGVGMDNIGAGIAIGIGVGTAMGLAWSDEEA